MKKTAVPGLALIHGDALIQTVISFVESLPHGGVFNGIQPTASALLSIEKTGVKEVARLNELIKRKKILVRGVLGNNYPKRLHKVYGNVWLQSFLGRTAHFVTVPEEYLSHGAELYLTHNRALIVDWKHDSGILIDNPHIFHMLESHYKFMHAMGTRIKHEEFAKLLH